MASQQFCAANMMAGPAYGNLSGAGGTALGAASPSPFAAGRALGTVHLQPTFYLRAHGVALDTSATYAAGQAPGAGPSLDLRGLRPDSTWSHTQTDSDKSAFSMDAPDFNPMGTAVCILPRFDKAVNGRNKRVVKGIQEDKILSQRAEGQLGYCIEVSVWNPSRHGPRPWERIGQEIIDGTYRSGWWVEANGITHWNEQPPKKQLEKHKERIISIKETSKLSSDVVLPGALEQPNVGASTPSWPHDVAQESSHHAPPSSAMSWRRHW